VSKLTVIADTKKGLFVGNYGSIAVFSKNDPFDNTKVCGFQTDSDARNFVEKHIPTITDTVEYLHVTSSTPDYVDVVDIIKAGYTKYTEEMLMVLPSGETLH